MIFKPDHRKIGRLPPSRDFSLLLGAILFGLLAGCTVIPGTDYLPQIGPTPPSHAAHIEYSFGVVPLHNAVQLFEMYVPLIDEINSHVSGITVRLETARDYPSYERKVRDRKLHFVMLNPDLVIPAEDHHYKIIGRTGDKVRGLIVIRKDSGIQSVRDLKSASISFGARTDLPGTMMPRILLKRSGLDVDQQAKPKYVGSQESALMNVYFGLSVAGCVSDSTWNAFKNGRPDVAQSLEVRWETEPMPGLGILARDDIPTEHVHGVARVLFGLNESASGRKILEAIKVSSFKPANSGTYDGLWEFLNGYRKLFGRTPTLGDAE